MPYAKTRSGLFGLALALFCQVCLARPIVHHDLQVSLHPSGGALAVQDTITLPERTSAVEFLLHANLEPEPAPGVTLTPIEYIEKGFPVPVRRYRARLAPPGNRFGLRYEGVIRHSLEQISKDYAGDLSQTPGLILPEGVFLSAASHWFPIIGNERLTFSLRPTLPEGWRLVSQGRALDGGWEEQSPQDDIYLVAAPYRVYRRPGPIAEALVYLRDADEPMAQRYLEATERYLDLYSRLLGPYPYAKFALVENFWESGYGMPSFTLLGPTVIRLPFIIHTSYPHEILHNWWGNGVYVDYTSGNWSEGLTSYLADHLLREQRGKGADYRRATLQRYADSVGQQEEFPLTAFRGRHGQASQAIGYGKTMMFFHMLRRQLGDRVFLEGLRRFYRDNLFRSAGFGELRQAFEAVSGQDLSGQFRQWTTRTGAPALQLGEVRVEEAPAGFRLSAVLRQTQPGPAFRLQVPILIQLAGERQPLRHLLGMTGKQARLELDLGARPLRIKVDPQFELFRRLDPSEIPSSLGQLFGSEEVVIVLPEGAPPELKSAYRKLAEGWARRAPGLKILWDRQLDGLPPGRAIWLFGMENRLRGRFLEAAAGKPFSLGEDEMKIGGRTFPRTGHSLVLTSANPAAPGQTLGWLAAHSAAAIPRLGRKLPHYQKYSYLVFAGDEAGNILKSRWPLADSALNITLPAGAGRPDLELPRQPALTDILSN
ncbi:MAG TPA: M1 family peptidase [Sedimenticola sp.]|nr:M1 family peptidase [Sedimenticola sp.]